MNKFVFLHMGSESVSWQAENLELKVNDSIRKIFSKRHRSSWWETNETKPLGGRGLRSDGSDQCCNFGLHCLVFFFTCLQLLKWDNSRLMDPWEEIVFFVTVAPIQNRNVCRTKITINRKRKHKEEQCKKKGIMWIILWTHIYIYIYICVVV